MHNHKPIHITPYDHKRLRLLLAAASAAARNRDSLNELAAELDRAVLVEPAAIPPGVVTMHSRVRIKDLDSGEAEEYVLSFPEQADAAQQRISVLAPIGTALLGYAEGDEIAWTTPGGVRRLKITQVQPPPALGEAAPNG